MSDHHRPALIILGQTLVAHSLVVPRVGDYVEVPRRPHAFLVSSVRWEQVVVEPASGTRLVPLVTMQASVHLEDDA